jgi:hypothetical protein
MLRVKNFIRNMVSTSPQGNDQAFPTFAPLLAITMKWTSTSRAQTISSEAKATAMIHTAQSVTQKAIIQNQVNTNPYIWFWKSRLPERKGQPCSVLARGRMNSILVEFQDGFRAVTSRYAIRKSNDHQ